MQDQLKNASQWKDLVPQILTYSQSCKTSINLQPIKQDIFSVIAEAVAQINFTVNIARFFRTPTLYNI